MGTTITTYSYQYNSFNKATKITQGDYELEIFYGHDKERRKTILKEGENTVYTRYYLGNYEKEITSEGTTEYYYVGGPMGNIAVYISENGAEPELYYTITDHLGSIVAVADEDGEILEEQRYDPWGNYRNPLTGEPEETPQLTMLFRGYTGHEMLPEFGLINMNGRLYDPVIARVLSPDNYVQNPNNPQNYNRYSYCLNNPLVYTDPAGEYAVIDDITAAILGGIINLGTNIIQGNIQGNFWQCLGKGSAAFGAGAVAGFGALYPEFGGWVWGGATVGATNAWLGGATSAGDIATGANVGIFSMVAGGMAGQWAVNTTSSLLNSISSPVLRGATTGVIGGTAGGYAGGFTGGFLMTGDLGQANISGLNNMWIGAGIGVISGVGYGYKYAVENNLNPWTGRSTLEPPTPLKPIEGYVSPNQKGQEGVNRAIEEINAQGGKVVMQEVTLEVNGVRVRVDIAADFNGEITLIEVKNGPSTGFTPNQKIVYPKMIERIPVIPRGYNASQIPQWQVGQPTTQYYLIIKKY